ncbi:hypothetical protein LZ554_006258 [Drepanopeziza brunnea f. sp. 'monogermtubi']|nr:hypothetical protein LZ554_006258 [Drepanopeziza brunnea f. sp. 'monogermtubi']
MADRQAIPKMKPRTSEFLRLCKMLSGPKVDIYVGKNKKHYNLPKELLCYYSPYFDRCFNGESKEVNEGAEARTLRRRRGGFRNATRIRTPRHIREVTTGAHKLPVGRRLKFLEYADKYGIAYPVLVVDPLRKPLSKRKLDKRRSARVTPGDIELIYRATHSGSQIRTFAVQDILSSGGGIRGHSFEKEEREIPEFAAELLDGFRKRLEE